MTHFGMGVDLGYSNLKVMGGVPDLPTKLCAFRPRSAPSRLGVSSQEGQPRTLSLKAPMANFGTNASANTSLDHYMKRGSKPIALAVKPCPVPQLTGLLAPQWNSHNWPFRLCPISSRQWY